MISSAPHPHLLLWELLSNADPEVAPAAPGARALQEALLRDSVRRELGLLFNSTALRAVQKLEPYAHAERSTLNYGLPDLAGKTASSIDGPWLEQQLTLAIRAFEPRLHPESVRVRIAPQRASTHNILCFEIDAVLTSNPDAEPIRLDTELDLESGLARVIERARA
jgi:type VI secretion system protein ImpF